MTTPITIVGNLTKDPELRFTPSGAAVCNLTVAVGERVKNQSTGEWEDGESTFYEVSVWNSTAENVAESLEKGQRVIVMGGLKGRKWTSQQDPSKSGTSLDINVGNDGAVGPDLKWATAKVTRAARNSGGGQTSQGQQGGQGGYAPPADDPWSTAPAPAGVGFGGGEDEPPF